MGTRRGFGIVTVLIGALLLLGVNLLIPQESFAQTNPDEAVLLARVVFAEAAGEPVMGQYAVASVVVNRVHHDGYPDTLYKVIHQKNAFASVTGQGSRLWRLAATPERMNQIERRAWAQCLQVAHRALYEHAITGIIAFRTLDCTGGSRYFDQLTPVCEVGHHRFYEHRT